MKNPKLVKGRKIFIIFLSIWLLLLCGAIYMVLRYVHNFLTDYQAEYDASRPELAFLEYYEWYQNKDIDSIYDNLTSIPTINEYETATNAQYFIDEILDGRTITYEEDTSASHSMPRFYIYADNFIVSELKLQKSTSEHKKYGFPVWELSSLDIYCEPQYDIRLSFPENVTAFVNGIPVDEKYCYYTESSPADQKYYGDYATLPLIKKYKIDGFYELPKVTATNSDGHICTVDFNESTGIYEIDYGINPQFFDMKNIAISAAEVFANYLANDVSELQMKSFFVENCEIIDFIIAGREDAGKFFKHHSSIEYTNIVVDQFTSYDSNIFSCDVHMDQEIYNYSKEPREIASINYRFYFIYIDDEWKACNFAILPERE